MRGSIASAITNSPGIACVRERIEAHRRRSRSTSLRHDALGQYRTARRSGVGPYARSVPDSAYELRRTTRHRSTGHRTASAEADSTIRDVSTGHLVASRPIGPYAMSVPDMS
eukprot:1157693-Rhodomonas_salina.2